MANETKKGGSGLPLSQPRENLLGGQNYLTGRPQGSSAQSHDQKAHGLCTEPPSDSKDPGVLHKAAVTSVPKETSSKACHQNSAQDALD